MTATGGAADRTIAVTSEMPYRLAASSGPTVCFEQLQRSRMQAWSWLSLRDVLEIGNNLLGDLATKNCLVAIMLFAASAPYENFNPQIQANYSVGTISRSKTSGVIVPVCGIDRSP